MQSGQKQKKRLVPWFNSAEWFTVFNLIYNKESDKTCQQKALNILKIWKSRTALLQSGVEGTLIILRAILLDENHDSYSARLIKSTSVMRFLNICAANDKRQGTFYSVAKRRKIPEWIISLRHDAAHSQDLPMSDILNNALNFCLDWLYKNYWLPISTSIKDYVDTYDVDLLEHENLKNALEPFVTNYMYVKLSLHPNWNYVTIGSIPDPDVKTSITNDLKALLGFENLNDKTRLAQIIKKLWFKIEQIFQINKTKQKLYIIPELILEGDLFLYNVDQFETDEKDFVVLPKDFIFVWEKLLKNIHKYDMMPALLEKLMDVVDDEQDTYQRRKAAALWLAEIGKGFSKCIESQNVYKTISPEVKNKLSMKYLSLKLKHKVEELQPHFKDIVTLSLMSKLPNVFTNMLLFKQLFLRKPNEFTNIFLSRLLEVCDEFKSVDMRTKILELNNLYINVKRNIDSSKIRTVQDLLNIESQEKDVNNSDIVPAKQIGQTEDIDTNHNDERWQIVTDIDFGKYPIGILPWQTTNINPLLNI